MDNRAFWNERYRTLPWLGSGPGSRGISQQYKASLLGKALRKNDITSVVDVGCGDLCWLRTDRLSVRDLEGIRYVGFDISEAAVDANRHSFPELEFELYDLGRDPLPMHADLVLCFDVLIHQTSREQLTACLTHLLDGIERHALVSYKNPDRPREAAMPHLAASDSAIETEMAFQRSFAELQERVQFPRATTANFGALPCLISALSARHTVARVGDYDFQSVFEVALGERLEF